MKRDDDNTKNGDGGNDFEHGVAVKSSDEQKSRQKYEPMVMNNVRMTAVVLIVEHVDCLWMVLQILVTQHDLI